MKFKIGQEVRIRRPEHPNVHRPYAGRKAVIVESEKKPNGRAYGVKLIGIAFSVPHEKWYHESELNAIA